MKTFLLLSSSLFLWPGLTGPSSRRSSCRMWWNSRGSRCLRRVAWTQSCLLSMQTSSLQVESRCWSRNRGVGNMLETSRNNGSHCQAQCERSLRPWSYRLFLGCTEVYILNPLETSRLVIMFRTWCTAQINLQPPVSCAWTSFEEDILRLLKMRLQVCSLVVQSHSFAPRPTYHFNVSQVCADGPKGRFIDLLSEHCEIQTRNYFRLSANCLRTTFLLHGCPWWWCSPPGAHCHDQ